MTAFFHQSRSAEWVVMLGAGSTAAVCPPAVIATVPRIRARAQLSIFPAFRFGVRIAFPLFVSAARNFGGSGTQAKLSRRCDRQRNRHGGTQQPHFPTVAGPASAAVFPLAGQNRPRTADSRACH